MKGNENISFIYSKERTMKIFVPNNKMELLFVFKIALGVFVPYLLSIAWIK